MSAVTTWSLSASDNNSAPPNGWPEGQSAASVNNCARQMMADLAREFQVNAVKVLASVAGTNTITGSMTPDLASYSDGLMVIFRPANNSTGAATLNIDSLGARTIVKGDRAALENLDLQASSLHFAIYDATNSEFVLLNPLSVNGINATFSGNLTVNGSLTTDNTTADEAGFKGMPQNSQSGNYTLVLTDAGKHILQNTASSTTTIPANASVAFPVGSVITIMNNSAGNISIAITTDLLLLAGTSTTGTRTLASFGIATALKYASTSWIISGSGLS